MPGKKRPQQPPGRQGRLWVAAILALLTVALAVGFLLLRRSPQATSTSGAALGTLRDGARADALNVLVVTLDTTRWDRLGAYGDRTAQTPNLDRLAGEGVLFEQAITSVPLTLPAHSTLFTGVLPPRHGVRDNGGYVLDAKHRTLAKMLKDDGWKTSAFVSAFVLDGRWGLDQGFDLYFDEFDVAKYRTRSIGNVARRADEVTDAALSWLQKNAMSGRFFTWLHFYDAHTPYDPPEPFRSRFRSQPYAGEIAFVDFQLGRVLQWLDSSGLAGRTIVVAIGDHGESLSEHGETTHGLFIYDATTRIPFIVRTPFSSTAGRRVRSTVRSEDVLPTILDLLGKPIPEGLQGASLVSLLTGAVNDLNLDAYSESLYARHHYGWSDLRALRSGRYKYIATTRPELYDLERDPGESHNIIGERAPLAEKMAAELRRLAAESPDSAPASAVDPETRERLAALGYIGSFSQAGRKDERAVLPDAKDKIDIFNLMTAVQESGDGGGDGRLERLQRVVKLDPNILDAWIMLGSEYFRRGDYRTALTHYKQALSINPEYDLATINLANAYRALGDYNAALVGFERYLRNDPKNAWVRYQMGELFTDLNQLDKAESAFRQALIDDTRVAAARNALGVLAFKRGDLARAEQEIRAALAQKPDVKLAHFNLALVAEQRGDIQTAIREYRTEIETQPHAFKAAFNLAKLYDQTGDAREQEAAYRKALELNPRFAEGYFYLAKLYLDQGRNFEEAIALAKRGLEFAAQSGYAPLGHYVLADLYNRRGEHALAAREAARGRALEAALKARRQG